MVERTLIKHNWLKNSVNPLFSQENFNLPADFSASFEYKHHLCEHLATCHPTIIPKTWYIDDKNYSEIYHLLSEHEGPWILKPALMNNGQGIVIFNRSDELLAHYQQKKRFSGPHVLQHYISPHLLNGHKYSIRMFLVYCSEQGAYLYQDGYFNICRKAYAKDNFEELTSHLSNEHFGECDTPNTYQVPTSRCDFFGPVFQDIKRACQQLLTAYYKANILPIHSHKNKLAILGLDFMLDEKLKLYLLEVNHGACFATSTAHPLYECFYEPFFDRLVKKFILNHPTADTTFIEM